MSDRYAPSQAARLLGGLQWAVTAIIIGSTVMSLYIDYLAATNPSSINGTISFATEFSVGSGLAFVLGYLWVTRRTRSQTQEADGIKQRIDYVFFLWLGWPVVYFGLSNILATLSVDLTPVPYLSHVVLGFGDIISSVIVVYWLQVGLLSRFLSG